MKQFQLLNLMFSLDLPFVGATVYDQDYKDFTNNINYYSDHLGHLEIVAL